MVRIACAVVKLAFRSQVGATRVIAHAGVKTHNAEAFEAVATLENIAAIYTYLLAIGFENADIVERLGVISARMAVVSRRTVAGRVSVTAVSGLNRGAHVWARTRDIGEEDVRLGALVGQRQPRKRQKDSATQCERD